MTLVELLGLEYGASVDALLADTHEVLPGWYAMAPDIHVSAFRDAAETFATGDFAGSRHWAQ